MGVLADILVANESEAETIGSLTYPLGDGRWKGIDAKGFDITQMGELLGVLTSEPYQSDEVNDFVTLYDGNEAGPWVYKVPDQLTDRLAELPDARLEEVARAWVAHESFPGRWWIELEHRKPKGSFLARLFGRGGSATVEEKPPDFTPLLEGAKQILEELHSLARDAKEQNKHLLMWCCT